ncbi:AraC family transcriptional regulator [Burkholderia lata]|uniref:AraC family transcriptional regulator n=1 Tax=Burkholderia lata (strain ATCC 17760 / DSM 23089 / LMG 22485 / NCIMB 9086 / R18194 / 383) TaxID=482957 RepID=A0A6P2SY39_BURL3|nr:AraC family transcriptional regulator [Burkholderia lata]VWC55801.1 AraC family transcriptional regulator [Burkholderia lata]
MCSGPPPIPSSCPDPLARAPRVPSGGQPPHARLYPAPAALQGAVVAIALQDTRGFALSDAQRLSHFPATPLVCVSWYRGLEAGFIENTVDGPRWRPFGAAATLSGSHSFPTVAWSPTGGQIGMICFTADAARVLFDLALSDIHDRVLDASVCLGDRWRPLLDALLVADRDADALAAIERHLAPRWRALRPTTPLASLRNAGRSWVQRLALQAREWRHTHSPRQVERRIKTYSGRSLREWQTIVKTESAFFAARDRFEAGAAINWAALALDEGFADQAHLSREVKRITGFSPSEFSQRFIEDESFWMYRLWV